MMPEREIVTSPTLKPKKAARMLENMSSDSTPQGASASMTAAVMSPSWAAPASSTDHWSRDSRRSPRLTMIARPTRAWGCKPWPMDSRARVSSR